MIYFISDTHFGHKNIIRLSEENFSSIEERDNLIIDNIKALKKEDTLYILGDLSWYNLIKTKEIFEKFSCDIIVLKGNHDSTNLLNGLLNAGLIKSWHMYLEIKDADDTKFCLMHYPIEEWNGIFAGSVHIHGHIHGKSYRTPVKDKYGFMNQNRFDVGVSAIEYKPISMEEISEYKKEVVYGGNK